MGVERLQDIQTTDRETKLSEYTYIPTLLSMKFGLVRRVDASSPWGTHVA